MDAIVKLKGVEDLEKRLNQLEWRIGKRASSKALRKGANVIRDIARANALRLNDPKSPEVIAKNIVTQTASRRRQNQAKAVIMRIGVLGGARNMQAYGELRGAGRGNPGGDTWYWRLVEFGTSEFAAKPFMRPAIAQGAERAIQVTVEELAKQMDKEVAKMGVPSGS